MTQNNPRPTMFYRLERTNGTGEIMSTQAELVNASVLSGHGRMMAMFEAAEAFAEAMAPLLVAELGHQTGIRGVSFDRALMEVEEILGHRTDGARESAMDRAMKIIADDPNSYRVNG